MDPVDYYMSILEVKRYSKSTIKNYVSAIRNYQRFSDIPLKDRSERSIQEYVFHCVKTEQCSFSTQKQIIGALRLFYREVYKREPEIGYLYPDRKQKFLPTVLSPDEVNRILANIANLKHRCIIMTLYGAGLRVGEVCQLNVRDIDSNRMSIHIREGKGLKDRMIPLPEKLLSELRIYWKQYKPSGFLFPGQTGGSYSPKSVQMILKRASNQAGIRKKVTPHSLRHTYATHLLEQGTDIRLIQQLLGHNSIKTTQLYLHISKAQFVRIKSPLDTL